MDRRIITLYIGTALLVLGCVPRTPVNVHRGPASISLIRKDEVRDRIKLLFGLTELKGWTFLNESNSPITIDRALEQSGAEIRLLSPLFPETSKRYGLRLKVLESSAGHPPVLTKISVAVGLYDDSLNNSLNQKVVEFDLNSPLAGQTLKLEEALGEIENQEFGLHSVVDAASDAKRKARLSSTFHVGYFSGLSCLFARSMANLAKNHQETDLVELRQALTLEFISNAFFQSALSTLAGGRS